MFQIEESSAIFAAYNQGVEDAKAAIRGEKADDPHAAPSFINAIARKCSPHRYVIGINTHEKGRLIGVRLFDLLDLVVAARESNRNFAQHFLADATRPVSDEEIEAFAQSLLRSPEYSAEDVDETREMIREWRSCEETIHSVLSADEGNDV